MLSDQSLCVGSSHRTCITGGVPLTARIQHWVDLEGLLGDDGRTGLWGTAHGAFNCRWPALKCAVLTGPFHPPITVRHGHTDTDIESYTHTYTVMHTHTHTHSHRPTHNHTHTPAQRHAQRRQSDNLFSLQSIDSVE